MVHDAVRAAAGLSRTAAAVLLAAVLVLAGCGSGDDGSGSEGSSGGPTLDEPIQIADCTDWNEGSVEERLGTIEQIRTFVGGPVPGTGGRGITFDEDEAYDLFERACSNDFARAFTLYRIYVRATAVAGRAE